MSGKIKNRNPELYELTDIYWKSSFWGILYDFFVGKMSMNINGIFFCVKNAGIYCS